MRQRSIAPTTIDPGETLADAMPGRSSGAFRPTGPSPAVTIATRGLLRTGRRIDLKQLEQYALNMNDILAVMQKEVAYAEEECL